MAVNDVFTPPITWMNRQIVTKATMDEQVSSNMLSLFNNAGRRYTVKPPALGIQAATTSAIFTPTFTVDLPAPSTLYVRSIGVGQNTQSDTSTGHSSTIMGTITLSKNTDRETQTFILYDGQGDIDGTLRTNIVNQYFTTVFNTGTWQIEMSAQGATSGTDFNKRNRNAKVDVSTYIILEFSYYSADRFIGGSPVTG